VIQSYEQLISFIAGEQLLFHFMFEDDSKNLVLMSNAKSMFYL